MTVLSLREAAEQAGTSKSTIWRAIKSGRMSATRTDDGGFAIDPAELFRAFPPERPSERLAGQDATALASDAERPATPETARRNDELAVKLVAAEEKIEGLKALLAEVRSSRDRELERADRAEHQAHELTQRLALPAPKPQPIAASEAARRPWWPWRRAG